MPAGLGIPGQCSGYFELCVFISRGADAKTPYIAYGCLYAHTDIRIAYSVVTNTLFAIAHQMQCFQHHTDAGKNVLLALGSGQG